MQVGATRRASDVCSLPSHCPMSKTNEKNGGLAMFCEIAKIVGELWRAMFDTYQPELHYMRGPGPKWHAKR
jgi:hypothetical protein